MDFCGRTAIVTGGAKGIGRSCCEVFAANGANVVVADINEEGAKAFAAELTAKGQNAVAAAVNVKSVESIRNMVRTAEEAYGQVDILVNNAGILHTTPIEDITEEEWDNIVEINLKSVFFASQTVIPGMKARKYGKILNMSSLAGRHGGIANGLGYSATKAGIIGLTRGLASRLAAFGINVNAVAPGSTDTGILDTLPKERIDYLVSQIPVGRFGKPEEISAAVAFLCSDDASFVTGAVLDVNGGMYFG